MRCTRFVASSPICTLVSNAADCGQTNVTVGAVQSVYGVPRVSSSLQATLAATTSYSYQSSSGVAALCSLNAGRQ